MNRENRELTFVNIEAKGFQDICDKLAELEKENKQLQQDLKQVSIHEEMLVKENEFLDKQNRALKLRCGKYSLRISDLESEIEDMKFTRNYLTSEEAGRQFAKELLGGA